MELTGLTLTQVLTVLGAVGGGVLILYLLKLRRRQVSVPFVKLWETVLAEKQTTRLLSQLKRWLSFLIALLIVALLAFSLGDPRYAGATASGRTIVVLVDASASMQATDAQPTRFERARERVRRLIDELGPADRMLVAQMDATATPVSPLSGDRRILLDAVDALAVTDVAADLGAGVRLGLDVLRGQPGAELVIVSDGKLAESAGLSERMRGNDTRLSWIKVGRSDRNVGISAFAVRRYPLDKSQSEVLVELWNPSDEDLSVEMTLLGDGEAVDVQRLVVRKGERLRRFFRNVSGVDKTLEARIRLGDGSHDDLPADDRAYARLPERRRARVLAVSGGDNLYLQAALLLDEYLDVTELAPSAYPPEGRFDVTIFDRFVPPDPPPGNAIYLFPQPAEGVQGPLEVIGEVERPWFDMIDRDHPLTRWTALADVNIGRALTVRPERGDRVVGGDDGVPLIVEGTRNGQRFVAVTFDIRESDLPLRIAWPLLLLNTIDWFVQEGAGYVSSYRTGETWHVPVPAGMERATIEDPNGERREVPVVEGRAVYAGSEAGFYRLRTPEGTDVFAANLGPGDESDIGPADRVDVAGRRAGQPTAGRAGLRRELWVYLLFAVIAILIVEWLTYHRRWTV